MKLTLALFMLAACPIDKSKIVCNNGPAATNPAAIELNIVCPEF